MDRAYSQLTIKTVNEDRRILTGTATTPTADRMGDIVEPKGAEFTLPIPFLWQHDSGQPIGEVTKATVTKTGIDVQIQIAKIDQPGRLKDRVDEAWDTIKAGLVKGLSIGFTPKEHAYLDDGSYGMRFVKWLWLELSAVTIAANGECSISTIKSIDHAVLAATGHKDSGTVRRETPGASGTSAAFRGTHRSPKGNIMKTMQELREERVIKTARMAELQDIGELGDAETVEFDTLEADIKALDTDMRKMRVDALKSATATPVAGSTSTQGARSRSSSIIVTRQDPDDKFKGQSFIRKLKAQGAAWLDQRQGGGLRASEFAAAHWGKTNPNLVSVIKANEVAGGGTGSGEWGAELVGIDNRYNGDFVDFLYGLTVYDRIGMRPAPRNVSVKGMDGAATGYWVGESKGIPVSKPDFSTVDLTTLKAAGICIASKELLADSDPAAEMLIRDALAEAISQRIDTTFLSTTAASAGVSPAGILNGVTALTTTGTDQAAVIAMLKALNSQFFTDKNSGGLVLVMTPAMALAIGLIQNALGLDAFPGLTAEGGTLKGMRVVTGNNVGGNDILLIKPRDIWIVGDEGLQVSMSDSAMIEQNSAPTGATDTPVAASVTMVSMFQEDSVAIKVVRRTSYKKRRANAVQYVTDADFDGTSS